jgi:RNA polymerase sigma-70 factor, ECF subfamily
MGVIRALPGFEGRATLRTWVFRILINVARRRGRIEARAMLELEGPTVDPDRFREEDDPYPGHWRDDAALARGIQSPHCCPPSSVMCW